MTAPKLRFKEFDGDWNSNSLGNIADFTSGYAFDSEKFGESGRKLITPKNFTTLGYALFTKQNTKFTTESCDEKFVCHGNDLLILLTDLTQSCELLGKPILLTHTNEEVLLNQRILKVEPNKDIISKLFLLNFFLTEKYLKHIKETSTGTTVRHSSNKILSKYEVFFPSKEEQTKIASFLSAVDEKISQLSQKLHLLDQYKQAMMQKLFSQQIRFKADDGSEFGEWEEVKLGNLVDLISGFAFKSDFFSEDGNKLITPKNFTTTGKANFTDTNTKWTTETSDGKYICSPNDLLVLLTDLTQSCELLGKPVLLSQEDGKVLLNQRIVKIIPDSKLDKPFLLYLLLTDDFHELIVSTASGTTVKHSSNKVLQSFTFNLPCREEQTKIANFLSAIDQKIEVVAQQIEQAKQWKKGLLQQMFV